MARTSLRTLANDPRFIAGIYNYCDSWCERCRLSSRCLVFAKNQADGEPSNDEELMRQVSEALAEATTILQEQAAEEGIDLSALPDAVPVAAEMDQVRQAAREHPIVKGAMEYEALAEAWLSNHTKPFDGVDERRAVPPADRRVDAQITEAEALAVIRWYHFFIRTKLYRALMSMPHDEPDADLAAGAQGDANGSAKVAILAMELTLDAWFALINLRHDMAGIVPILRRLSALVDDVEKAFPAARRFVRPGFDTADEPWPDGITDAGPIRH